jgi:hypothetical protein
VAVPQFPEITSALAKLSLAGCAHERIEHIAAKASNPSCRAFNQTGKEITFRTVRIIFLQLFTLQHSLDRQKKSHGS